jgi:hypothetical protein
LFPKLGSLLGTAASTKLHTIFLALCTVHETLKAVLLLRIVVVSIGMVRVQPRAAKIAKVGLALFSGLVRYFRELEGSDILERKSYGCSHTTFGMVLSNRDMAKYS